ncbi:hypothetical protein SODALDRAFT_382215 [Sodiomyces alkalinus F11]|uniref:Uncharacterized protein n=1 Tax=Sodiomyces alkalinus (strain CBS 110278 / VKM F-3762 / F11) TaxID=1314773 RepID=A0A3N2PJS6_SODAK|nr:hypothetical protein SODALDRAFT_382215 [Sodiomyces alkalinus F11]ROT34634.1 hypothetical protein SODALDRAFT_382215 [Sodiomyces alkalinus F11]
MVGTSANHGGEPTILLSNLNIRAYIDETPLSYGVRYASPRLINEFLRRGWSF